MGLVIIVGTRVVCKLRQDDVAMMIMMVDELGSKGPIDCTLNESGVRTVTNSACLINSIPMNY